MILAALLLAQAAAAPACPATPVPLPPALAGWRQGATELAAMKAVTLDTVDPAMVRLADAPPPEHPGQMAMASFRVSAAGTYGIALDQKGWIDIYTAGSHIPLVSTQHGHGPTCSGIRKIVRFALTPGEYRVVVGGLEGARAKLMLVKG